MNPPFINSQAAEGIAGITVPYPRLIFYLKMEMRRRGAGCAHGSDLLSSADDLAWHNQHALQVRVLGIDEIASDVVLNDKYVSPGPRTQASVYHHPFGSRKYGI